MNHIVNTCLLTNLKGKLQSVHGDDDYALIWLQTAVTAASQVDDK